MQPDISPKFITETPDYGWKDDWVAKPAHNAIVIDATQATLVTDMVNTLGESFHNEYPPTITRKQADASLKRSSQDPGREGNGPIVKMEFKTFIGRE